MKKITLFFLFFHYTLFAANIIPHPNNKEDKRDVYLAACLVFQNEAPYLKEWIEYHRLVGVEHFYLYNNNSSDEFLQVLEPYMEEGLVEFFEYPEKDFNDKTQVVPYNHALLLSRGKATWLAVIDADEFLCPVKDDTIPAILKKFEHAPLNASGNASGNISGLNVHWQNYGTSGVKRQEPHELLIETLLWKYPQQHWLNHFTKSIVQPEKTVEILDPHFARYRKGSYSVYANGKKYRGKRLKFAKLPIEEIRINHYRFRNEEYYFSIKLPRIEKGNPLPPAFIQSILQEANSVQDPIMERFIPATRIATF